MAGKRGTGKTAEGKQTTGSKRVAKKRVYKTYEVEYTLTVRAMVMSTSEELAKKTVMEPFIAGQSIPKDNQLAAAEVKRVTKLSEFEF